MRRRVKLMWDYDAFPVWELDRRAPDDPGLAIKPGLAARLQKWSDDWTAICWGKHGPDSPKTKPPTDEQFKHWDAQGRELARELQATLGSSFLVGYFNERTKEVEWSDGSRS